MPNIPVEASAQYSATPDAVQLMNVIRANASQAYQDRIPESTVDNLREVGSALFNYQPGMNEFLNALVNRIGRVQITNRMYRNPLAPFKEGMLELGETTEEIFVNLIKAQTYDPIRAQSTLFKRRIPDVRAVFHTMNDKRQYPFTISNDQLRTAFLSYQGIEQLIAKIVDSAYASDNYDEYLIMKKLIAQAGENGHLATVALTPITNEATAKQAVVQMRTMSMRFTFMSDMYNYAGVKTYTDYSDQVIFISPEMEANIGVNVLAYAFNMSEADYLARRVIIDDFGGLENVICVLVDRAWFKVYDNFLSFTEVYNAEGLYWNYFLNHWETFSYSPFTNALAFVAEEGTITSIEISPSAPSVAKGGDQAFTVEWTTEGIVDKSLIWSVTGNTSQLTEIDYLGNLYIAEDETATSLTVTAVSRADSTIKDTATVTVTA